MHGQEIFQVFTDLNHSDLGLCTGYTRPRDKLNYYRDADQGRRLSTRQPLIMLHLEPGMDLLRGVHTSF